MKVDPSWKMKGWALEERLDKEKAEKEEEKRGGPRAGPTLGGFWIQKTGAMAGFGGVEGRYPRRPTLDGNSTAEDLADEIEWIQATLVSLLNEHTRKITICARSKRWWNEDIQGKRKGLGRLKRRRRQGLVELSEVREAEGALRRAIRRARRECREEFLSWAEGEDVWAVTRYTGPQRSAAVPTIRHQERVAEEHGDKSRMLMDISFPAPAPYAGDEGERGPPGRAHLAVDEHLVEQAFQGTSSKKSPGPDGIGPLAVRCLFSWDRHRIVELIRTHI